MKKDDQAYRRLIYIRNMAHLYTEKIKEMYKEKLNKVILYGSYARGDYTEESDVDIMILLDVDKDDANQKVKEVVATTYDFNMDNDVDIEPMVESVSFYNAWNDVHPFYRNVKEEGVVLYEPVQKQYVGCHSRLSKIQIG